MAELFKEDYVDAYGIKRKKRVVFTDLDLSFDMHPGSNDLLKIYNEESIKRALMNLVLTRKKERLFQPDVGCNVTKYLFEMVSPLTAINIRNEIENCINAYEPRVDLEKVIVEESQDGHGYDVTIIYQIVNNTDKQEIKYFLERIR